MKDAAILATLKARLFRNSLKRLRRQSRLKIAVVTIFGAGFWTGLFFMFFEGFDFLGGFPGLKERLVEYLFSLFFMSLMLMLIFSNGIVSFSAMFRSREVSFLLSNPVRAENVFLYKLFESVVFSSWAFMFLGAPLILAHGVTSGASWRFYPIAATFFAVFIFIPAALGALATMVIVGCFPRNRNRVLALLVAVIAVPLTIWGVSFINALRGDSFGGELWMENIFRRISFCQNPFLPSYWISRGIIASSRGDVGAALFFFLMIVSNALFVLLIAYWFSGRKYLSSWSLVQSHSRNKRYKANGYSDRLLNALLFFLQPSTRLLVIKDLKSFRRDPVQWSQFLIFFGLLGIYILNLRNLNYDISMPYWKSIISFLNLGATSLTLSTFTSRFVFPALSLEGKRFWMLGLLPVQRRSILMGKFIFASGGTILISEVLISLSDYMLEVPFSMALLHSFTVIAICLGLSAISVGLGATFPNLKEDNPSKIVGGFGGTLNLMVSLIFITIVIALIAGPCHLYFAKGLISLEAFKVRITIGVAAAILISLLTCVIPMRIGLKSFENMEF